MQMTEADLQRVRRRLGAMGPRFWGLPLTVTPTILLLIYAMIEGVDSRGNPLKTSAYVSMGVVIALALGVLAYFMPRLARQYLGLRRDLSARQKETVMAPVRRKQRQTWNNHTQTHYLRFDFGRVEVGRKLYHSVREGQLLALVLSRHGRELLRVSPVEMQVVPWQLTDTTEPVGDAVTDA